MTLPLMFQAIAKEFELSHSWQPMPPDREGWFLVTAQIDDESRGTHNRIVRLDYFDGTRFPRMGGYVKYKAWREVPEPWWG